MDNNSSLFQIAISVTDLEKTIAFYRDIFGCTPFKKPQKLKGNIPSKIQGQKNVKAIMSWMNDANPSFQLEFFQYTNPQARPMPADAGPCDIGYSRMGVWVKDYDVVLKRLENNGTMLLSEPVDLCGGRRVFFRDPDGVFVELMENRIDNGPPSDSGCPAATQFVTLSVPDLQKAKDFFGGVLGMEEAGVEIHPAGFEKVFGLERMTGKSLVLRGGPVLLEIAEYADPAPKPLPEDWDIGMAGIWHVAMRFKRRRDFFDCYNRAVAAGYSSNSRPVSFGFMNFVYMKTDQGFTVEFAHFPEWMGRFAGVRGKSRIVAAKRSIE